MQRQNVYCAQGWSQRPLALMPKAGGRRPTKASSGEDTSGTQRLRQTHRPACGLTLILLTARGRLEQTSPHARRVLPSDGSAEKTATDYADKPLGNGRGHDEKDTRGRAEIGWLGGGEQRR